MKNPFGKTINISISYIIYKRSIAIIIAPVLQCAAATADQQTWGTCLEISNSITFDILFSPTVTHIAVKRVRKVRAESQQRYPALPG
jgi:hypothetical protein